MIREPHSRILVGHERSLVVDEHMRWLNGRWPSAALRDLDHDPRVGDSPIASWSRGHSHALAVARSRVANVAESRNRKRFDRQDDAPPLIDEVTHV